MRQSSDEKDTSADRRRAEQTRLRDAYTLRDQGRQARRRGRHKWSQVYASSSGAHRRSRVRKELEARGFLPLDRCRVLDVGCGFGGQLLWFKQQGGGPADVSRLTGLDLLPWRLSVAQEKCPSAHFVAGDGCTLPFRNDSFDVVVQNTVFSSILDEAVRADFASEMLRVLTRGGLIVWYDLRWTGRANPNTKGVGRREITRLFAGAEIDLELITLVPLIGRRVPLRVGEFLHTVGRIVPYLRSHYLGFIQTPAVTRAPSHATP